jgi:hypothetical protein
MADGTEIRSIARLTPPADVLARVDALVKSVAPREIEIGAAIGRILAGDINAVLNPRVPLALRTDGRSALTSLTTPAPTRRRRSPPRRGSMREPMPAGTDAVAPLDVVVERGGQADIIAPVAAAGEGVLPAGRILIARRHSRGRPPDGHQVRRSPPPVTQLQVREPRVRLVRARAAGDAVTRCGRCPDRKRDRRRAVVSCADDTGLNLRSG